MKVHNSYTQIIIWTIIIAIISKVIYDNTLIVEASENKVNASKIYDIALTKTGVIANKTTIDSVINQTINTIEGTAQSFKEWCEDNGKERNATSWQEYLESDAYSSLPFRLSAWALRSADIINYIITGESLTDELRDMIPEALVGSPIVDIANGITIPSDVVEEIRQEFDNYIYEYGDYFYLKTFAPEDLCIYWFETIDKWEKSVGFLETIPGYCYINITSLGEYGNFTFDSTTNFEADNFEYYVYADTDMFLSTYSGTDYEYKIEKVYNADWTYPSYNYYVTTFSGFMDYLSYEEMVNKPARYGNTYTAQPKLKKSGANSSTKVAVGLYSNDGRLVKVFRNENAMKAYTVGRDSYYVTGDSQNYVNNTDNSVKVSGDYLINNANTYSHDVIQNTIDNSENITQETVNNIVNTSSSTIINNYYSSDSGSGDDSGSGNSSILDGLGKIISALAEIIGFLLGAIGDVIGLIGNLFTTVFNGIKSIGAIFSGFSGLLGELFIFVPKELVDFIVLAIEASVAIVIWKKFKD